MMQNAANIKDWADQQMRERRHQADCDAEEEKNWAAQVEATTRMRGMLEDENHARKVAHHKQMVEDNKRMALEKRMREQAARDDGERQNQLEVTLTNHNEVLQLDGKTLRTDNHQ